MTIERVGLLKFSGKDVTIVGPDVLVGQKAPEFTVVNQDWSAFNGLQDTNHKVRIILSLSSLSTSVCDQETRRFNQEITGLNNNIVILAISMDLPFTIKNWCAAAGVDGVKTLSDHQDAEFGQKYGVLIKEFRILRRAAFVVNQNDTVIYSAYMPAIGDEPDYAAVLKAAQHAISG